MSIFGFEPPAPPPEPEPKKPVSLNELRHLLYLVDLVLRNTTQRQSYSSEEVQDLLFDIRNLLDNLTSPTVLLDLTRELYADAKKHHKEVGGND
jgi:hypothetical protein